MAKLFLIRHGKSEWNAKGLWTGWKDPGLSPEGREEAKRAAAALKGEKIDRLCVSALKRAGETMDTICHELGDGAPVEREIYQDFNERDYGIYTGKNKWEIQRQVGEEKFQRMRRAWDEPIPEGETLKDVYARVIPCFESHVWPELEKGNNVLLVAHGNSLRALIKYLEDLSEEEVERLEVGLAEVYVYEFDKEGKIINKQIRAANTEKGKV